ncbi:hypothetical protein V6N12_034264 [Hibiscus sabdariffa]|uniref:Uncharacterized protein n=1 Tax=Hibiscus sabdariffa TaxID=183260 RepID=A0ABR2BH94_9ROSI
MRRLVRDARILRQIILVQTKTMKVALIPKPITVVIKFMPEPPNIFSDCLGICLRVKRKKVGDSPSGRSGFSEKKHVWRETTGEKKGQFLIRKEKLPHGSISFWMLKMGLKTTRQIGFPLVV